MERKVEEIISADKKSIGFDYQHYYALLLLLRLKSDEELGIEVKDDIHIYDKFKNLSLMQLKHSLLKKADGGTINLRERDYDLWHSLSNWIDLIKDNADGRATLEKQLKFIEKTSFVIVSNKSINESNEFLTKLGELKNDKIKISAFKAYCDELYKNTKDSDEEKSIKKYIDKLRIQDISFLQNFLLKLGFTLGQDDLIEEIKKCLEIEFAIDKSDVEDVLNEIEGKIRITEYIQVKNGFKKVFTKEDFSNAILKPCFNKIRKLEFNISEIKDYFPPKNTLNQIFAKQLFDINMEEQEIAKQDYNRKLCVVNLKKWSERKLIISPVDRDNFFENTKTSWLSIHRLKHRRKLGVSEEDCLFNAQDCYDECMREDLILHSTHMERRISNGAFIELSNLPEIGWSHDWLTKYRK